MNKISMTSLGSLLNDLERSAQALAKHFTPPLLTEVNGNPAFRHEVTNDLLLSHLKCIRSSSSLNAAFALLQAGYVQEVGVLCRVVDEFCEDVIFLATPLGENGKYSGDQRRLVEEFFQEEFGDDPGPLMQGVPRHRVSRDKIRAGIARISGMPINRHDAAQIHRTIGKTLSGYVHGAYGHIMEMYGGPTLDNCRFHTSGMHAAPRLWEMCSALSDTAYRSALALETVARRCGDSSVAGDVRASRSQFEAVTRVGLGDAAKLLRDAKAKHNRK